MNPYIKFPNLDEVKEMDESFGQILVDEQVEKTNFIILKQDITFTTIDVHHPTIHCYACRYNYYYYHFVDRQLLLTK